MNSPSDMWPLSSAAISSVRLLGESLLLLVGGLAADDLSAESDGESARCAGRGF